MSASAWKGLSWPTFTVGLHLLLEREGVGIWAGSYGKRLFPPLQQLAHVRCMGQLLGQQQRLVPHLEHSVNPACVQLRLQLPLRLRQELAHSQLQIAN